MIVNFLNDPFSRSSEVKEKNGKPKRRRSQEKWMKKERALRIGKEWMGDFE